MTKLLDATNPNFYDPVDENEFDAFGNGGANNYSRMGYAGQYHDAETGFIYLRARYYNPAIGRFISEDPHWNVENMIYGDEPETDDENQPVKPNYSSIVQSSNLYPYCTNNPVRLVDPSGEFVEWGAIVIIAICSLMLTSCGGDNWAYEHGRPASPAIPAFPGWDATIPPGAGWEWRGNGEVGSAYGAWYNPNTGESLHADFYHGGDIDPHWDYIDPNGTQYRIFEDGSYEVK